MVNIDKFPEAFKRFEHKVNVKKIETFRQLTLAFGSWAGEKWRSTSRQMDALAIEARKRRIPLEDYRTRQQHVNAIFRTAQQTETQRIQFSSQYSNFRQWQNETARTTAYQRRIKNYMRNHPNASLAEARGHRIKRSS